MKVYIVNLDIDIYKKGGKKNHKFPITMDLAMFQRIEIIYHVLKFSILI
jgi:hypothetical protein